MKKIKQLSLVFTIFSLFMLSFFITSTFAISDEHAFRGSQMDQIPSNRQSRESHTGGIPQRNDRMEMYIEDEKRLGEKPKDGFVTPHL